MSKSISDPVWSPFTLDRAEVCTLRARSSGRTYRIMMSIPNTPPPAEGFPLLVILDGSALFATVAETERRLSHRTAATGVSPTVIVGVGHVGDGLYDPARRHDFTPCPPEDSDERDDKTIGGAQAFLAFLLDQVLPIVERRLSINPARRGLMGHSLAGYFVLDVLADGPGAFSIYAAVSPSVWWAPERLKARIQALSRGAFKAAMIAVGEREQVQAGHTGRGARRRMVDSAREAAQMMERIHGLDAVRFHVLADEDHASVVAPAATRALRLLGKQLED